MTPYCLLFKYQPNHMKLSQFLATVAAAAVATVAPFTPIKASSVEQHEVLWSAIRRAGVPIIVNHPDFCEKWGGGSYRWSKGKAILVICQDNGALVGAGNQAPWTTNDLDTLRHEAHHMVQDCRAGVIADDKMSVWFGTEEEYTDFVQNSLSLEQVKSIWNTYAERGATEIVRIHEIEAFAVAKTVSPAAIANAIDSQCH